MTKPPPSTKSLAQKLLIKPGMKVALLHAPEGYRARLEPLPADVTLTEAPAAGHDLVHLFVRSAAALTAYFGTALESLQPGGILWISYPKKSGAIKTDITRDHGWEVVQQADWHGVTQISLDATWSALRFRPRAEIKVMTRKF
jgi:hypothetical protein